MSAVLTCGNYNVGNRHSHHSRWVACDNRNRSLDKRMEVDDEPERASRIGGPGLAEQEKEQSDGLLGCDTRTSIVNWWLILFI